MQTCSCVIGGVGVEIQKTILNSGNKESQELVEEASVALVHTQMTSLGEDIIALLWHKEMEQQ